MTEQKYYDALTQQEVTEDFIKAQYEELTSKGDYFHDTYENFKNNNFTKIDTEAISWEQQPKTVTLTNELCSTLQCYILMTTKHREDELKAWEELAQETDENGAPKFKNAASNAEFLRDMEPQLQQILEALDSENMNAYKGDTLQNNKMLVGAFPKLAAGDNNISWAGNVTKIEIVPRWCKL